MMKFFGSRKRGEADPVPTLRAERPFRKDPLTTDPRTLSASFTSLVVLRADHRAFATILNAAFSDPDRKNWVKETVKSICDAPGLHKIDRDHRVVKIAFSEVAKHVEDEELKAHIQGIIAPHRESIERMENDGRIQYRMR